MEGTVVDLRLRAHFREMNDDALATDPDQCIPGRFEADRCKPLRREIQRDLVARAPCPGERPLPPRSCDVAREMADEEVPDAIPCPRHDDCKRVGIQESDAIHPAKADGDGWMVHEQEDRTRAVFDRLIEPFHPPPAQPPFGPRKMRRPSGVSITCWTKTC